MGKLSELGTKVTPIGTDLLTGLDSEDIDINTQNKNFQLSSLWSAIFGSRTTTDIPEGTNEYYTDAKVDTAIDNNSTIDTIESTLLLKADKTNVLELNNTTAFTPDADYEPSTKKYVDDAISGGGGNINFSYPHDITAGFLEVGKSVTSGVTYTVPVGKVLYIMSCSATTNVTLNIGGVAIIAPAFSSGSYSMDLAIPVLANAGTVVSSSSTSAIRFTGFVVDENANIEPVFSSTTYTVPASKKYLLTSFFTTSAIGIDLTIDGTTDNFQRREMGSINTDISMCVLHQPIILGAGDSINSSLPHTGYLIPDTFIV